VQVREPSAAANEFLGRAVLDDPSVVDHQDAVGRLHR